jgi:hypothetical protein
VTPRREFGGAIFACVLGAGLVLLGLHQHWGRVYYKAPAPLPSGSLPVSGQSLLPAASALALAALACLAAVIATRGLARRAAGLVMAALGTWALVVLGGSISAASVLAAATGPAGPGGLAGSLPGGNSAIGGNSSGGSLPLIGTVSSVVWDGQAWRQAAMGGAVIVIMVGLITIWRGQRWPVMSARFDRPGPRRDGSGPGDAAAARGSLRPQEAAIAPARLREDDAAALWEALDHGEDLTEPAAREES